VWSSSNKIGPQVAGRMQRTAIIALIASWFGIIIYVWIRFQNIVFGVAAVIALIHDVLITVAALAISRWAAGAMGFLLVEDFKISLTIVAALLTIIGYSINDTIVIFDRLREIRGKSPEITAEMVNASLNQTLSRTFLTAFTVLIVVLVLYAFGGQGIHGFAFAMLIGVISGSYSTVFIATPLVLWLGGKTVKSRPKSVAA
jgi:SecD/SecF fusion protein